MVNTFGTNKESYNPFLKRGLIVLARLRRKSTTGVLCLYLACISLLGHSNAANAQVAENTPEYYLNMSNKQIYDWSVHCFTRLEAGKTILQENSPNFSEDTRGALNAAILVFKWAIISTQQMYDPHYQNYFSRASEQAQDDFDRMKTDTDFRMKYETDVVNCTKNVTYLATRINQLQLEPPKVATADSNKSQKNDDVSSSNQSEISQAVKKLYSTLYPKCTTALNASNIMEGVSFTKSEELCECATTRIVMKAFTDTSYLEYFKAGRKNSEILARDIVLELASCALKDR